MQSGVGPRIASVPFSDKSGVVNADSRHRWVYSGARTAKAPCLPPISEAWIGFEPTYDGFANRCRTIRSVVSRLSAGTDDRRSTKAMAGSTDGKVESRAAIRTSDLTLALSPNHPKTRSLARLPNRLVGGVVGGETRTYDASLGEVGAERRCHMILAQVE